jgi:hypothetical protein
VAEAPNLIGRVPIWVFGAALVATWFLLKIS